MRQLWVWLWLAVLVGQLSSLWVVKRYISPSDPILNAGEPQLLEMARETVEAWRGLASFKTERPAEPIDNSLLAREEWLLRMRDAEQAARARGIDVRLAEELQGWVQSSKSGLPEFTEGELLIAYIMDLDQWLQAFTDQESSVETERLFLQPDSSSPYPALHFELQGQPVQMATQLYEQAQSTLNWEVRELDLNRQSGEAEWWLRAICVFRDRVPE